MAVRIGLKITDGAGVDLAGWPDIGYEPGKPVELSFTGPDGAPWYATLDVAVTGMDAPGEPESIQDYSDYDLVSEVARRLSITDSPIHDYEIRTDL